MIHHVQVNKSMNIELNGMNDQFVFNKLIQLKLTSGTEGLIGIFSIEYQGFIKIWNQQIYDQSLKHRWGSDERGKSIFSILK